MRFQIDLSLIAAATTESTAATTEESTTAKTATAEDGTGLVEESNANRVLRDSGYATET